MQTQKTEKKTASPEYGIPEAELKKNTDPAPGKLRGKHAKKQLLLIRCGRCDAA